MGEVVCSTALLRCMQQQLPVLELHYWVAPHLGAGLVHNTFINHLHLLEDDPDLLPASDFDQLVDFRPSRSLRQWAASHRIAYLSAHNSFLVSFLSEHFGWYQHSDQPLPLQYFEVVRSLGVQYDGRGLNYFLGVADEIAPADIPLSHSAGYLALVVGESGYDKQVPLPLISAFCQRFTLPIILVNSTGASADAAALARIDPDRIYNACGKFTLNETADLLRRAKLVVSNENDLMQVAVAFNRPLLVCRSARGASPFFPPLYPKAQHRQGAATPFASWVWPAASPALLRKAAQGILGKREKLWVEQGLKLASSFWQGKETA